MAKERKNIETPDAPDDAGPSTTNLRWSPPGSWWRTTLAGAAALVLGLGLLWVLQLVAWPLALLIGGVALAAGLNPIVSRLSQWLPRTVSVILIYLLFALVVAVLVWVTIPPLVTQVRQFSDQLPSLIDQAQRQLNRWIPTDAPPLQDLVGPLLSVGTGGSMLLTIPQRLFELVTAFVVVLFISLYALILAPATESFLLSLFPERSRERVEAVAQKMMQSMGGFVRGTMIDAVVVGVLTYIGLLLIGFPFDVVLSVLAGVLEIVPVVGPVITAVLLLAVAVLQAPDKVWIILIFAIVLQQLESNILVPNIMREQAKVSPLLTLLALIAGERIGGLVGALVAIPLVAGLRVLLLEVVAPAVRTWTGAPPASEGDTGG